MACLQSSFLAQQLAERIRTVEACQRRGAQRDAGPGNIGDALNVFSVRSELPGGGTRSASPAMPYLSASQEVKMVTSKSATEERRVRANAGMAMLERVVETRETSAEEELMDSIDLAAAFKRTVLESQWALSLAHAVPLDASLLRNNFDMLPDNADDEEADNVHTEFKVLVEFPARSERLLLLTAPARSSASARQRRHEQIRKQRASKMVPLSPALLSIEATELLDRRNARGGDDFSKQLSRACSVKLLTKQEEVELALRLRSVRQLQAVEAALTTELGAPPTTMQWAKRVGLTTLDLERQLREGQQVKQKLMLANMRLIVSVAKKYIGMGLEFPELVSVGAIGLSRGIEKFDPDRGYKLSTYTHWWIRQQITRAVAEESRLIRLPVHVHDTLRKISRATTEILQAGEPSPSVERLKEAMGIPARRIVNSLKAKCQQRSLDNNIQPMGSFERGLSPHDVYEDRSECAKPWRQTDKACLEREVETMLHEELDTRVLQILKMRFGLGNGKAPATLSSVSKRFKLSKERVRQLEITAIKRLRQAAEERCLNLYNESPENAEW